MVTMTTRELPREVDLIIIYYRGTQRKDLYIIMISKNFYRERENFIKKYTDFTKKVSFNFTPPISYVFLSSNYY